MIFYHLFSILLSCQENSVNGYECYCSASANRREYGDRAAGRKLCPACRTVSIDQQNAHFIGADIELLQEVFERAVFGKIHLPFLETVVPECCKQFNLDHNSVSIPANAQFGEFFLRGDSAFVPAAFFIILRQQLA